MTKYLILALILLALYLYWKHHQKNTSTNNKATQTDANSFSDSLGNDYTIDRPILSHKAKRKLKKANDDD